MPQPSQVEDVLVEVEPEAEIELPLTIAVSTARLEEPALPAGLSAIALGGLESGDVDESLELDVPLSEHDGLELDLDQELDAQAFSLDADVEAGILAATQEWGDDVMTEGELGELLRATAAAVITGETLGITPAPDRDALEVLPVAEPEPVPAPAASDDEPPAFTETQPMAVAPSGSEPPRPFEHLAEAPRPQPVETVQLSAEPPASVAIAGDDSPGK